MLVYLLIVDCDVGVFVYYCFDVDVFIIILLTCLLLLYTRVFFNLFFSCLANLLCYCILESFSFFFFSLLLTYCVIVIVFLFIYCRVDSFWCFYFFIYSCWLIVFVVVLFSIVDEWHKRNPKGSRQWSMSRSNQRARRQRQTPLPPKTGKKRFVI